MATMPATLSESVVVEKSGTKCSAPDSLSATAAEIALASAGQSASW